MKRVLFLIALFCALNANAQNYYITFAGTGASTTVNSVKVENLTTGIALTLNGGDILHLTGTVGITSVVNDQLLEIKIYPNPLIDNSLIEFYPPASGDATISIFDMIGKPVAQIQSYLESTRQVFRLSGIKNGYYLVNIKGKSYKLSGKLLSNNITNGKIIIERISSDKAADEKELNNEVKGSQATIDMAYIPGMRLKFTGISENYRSVKTDIPAQDKTITFSFIPCTDGDNNNYPVVEIGTQIWMAENLKTTSYNNRELIGTTTPPTLDITNETAAKYQWPYDGDENNVAVYGRLYTWHAANDNRNICPAGWYIPKDADWTILTTFLGGETIAGGKLKEKSTAHWTSPNNGANDETGFTALPGGFRNINGTFTVIGKDAFLFCSSEYNTPNAWYRGIYYNRFDVLRAYAGKNYGLSIRCLKVTAPMVNTTPVTTFTFTSGTVGGDVISDCGATVTDRGVYWGASQNPVTTGTKLQIGNGTGSFSTSLSGLNQYATYYVTAYATNSIGTSYGDEVLFTTDPRTVPVLTTTAVSSITQTTATCGGNVTSDGGAIVTDRGIYWGTFQNPVTTGIKLQIGSGTGAFSTSLSGLNPNTTYYVTAYATNSIGTSYGEKLTFKTKLLTLPALTTTAVSSITQTTATCGGKVTSDGGAIVTARGLCWGTLANPTIEGNHTSDGTGTGTFSSNLAELTINTKYYVRAYATNSLGTNYGNEISFATKGATSTVSDIDGNTYSTIQIGTQVWMAENLKTTKYNDGGLIPNVPDDAEWINLTTPGYCWYDNNASTYKTPYGALYNWYAVNTLKLCPSGWHVPSEKEYRALDSYLGVSSGGKIKEAGTTHWFSPNTGATNETGWTGLPSGERYADFQLIGYLGFYWVALEYSTTHGGVGILYYNKSIMDGDWYKKQYGFSVRCVKD